MSRVPDRALFLVEENGERETDSLDVFLSVP